MSVPLASPQFPFWRIYLSKGNLEGMDHLKRDEGGGEGWEGRVRVKGYSDEILILLLLFGNKYIIS